MPNASSTSSAAAKGRRNPANSKALTPEMVGFRLLKLTNLMSRPFFGQFAKQHSLSLTEWRSVVVLASRPGSAAQDISAATGLHPMNISRAVIALRKAGLVEEARDPENHRRVLLWLSPSGKKVFQQIAPYAESQAADLLDVLTAEELTVLGRTVDKLIARAEEITTQDGD
ncbi:MAG: winged helix-turn-helix transcriptional regulator [Variovorax sp.]|nr:winged helix-turn-helix transcriptional regulator [Variovorax sp.]